MKRRRNWYFIIYFLSGINRVKMKKSLAYPRSKLTKATLFCKRMSDSEIIIQLDNHLVRVCFNEGNSKFIGAFGEVRKCQHKKIKAIRAVKILRKDALDAMEVERFIHEIDILKKLVRIS